MTDKKLAEIYLRITDDLLSGILSFTVIKTLREQFLNEKNYRENIFIGSLFVAHYNTIVLALANVIKPQKDSVHLIYLFECIRDVDSKKEFNDTTYEQLLVFISEFETQLDEISPITKYVISLRDKVVAHIDKKNINNPMFLTQNPPVKWDDLELAYRTIASRLIDMGEYFGINGLEFSLTLANAELIKETVKVYEMLYN